MADVQTLQCQACGGTYATQTADGMEYYHACPPLSRAEVAAAIVAGKIGYPPNKTADFYAKESAAMAAPQTPPEYLAADDWLRLTTFERANKRDENVASTAASADPAAMISEGAGVAQVVSVAGAVPPVTVVSLT